MQLSELLETREIQSLYNRIMANANRKKEVVKRSAEAEKPNLK